ncbi:uncharacterized protein BO97DRAFT_141695 [Aspergillus homomorphus CBS 101889]|uniref:Uncharacterized protein n=1 Tax=Aspergillus homomorphus (strain CBS 101889) TaxID=1450537 RepID=A0A395HQW9_ASPHC|nr:hypothetical protein BO97DRAFT_141695 [Aspergillus homomorphus CBS 101889]RAL10351.1 hypothetical protein BO97DRAFT_141695 [Aspergillus homomorphus CBS 101889]
MPQNTSGSVWTTHCLLAVTAPSLPSSTVSELQTSEETGTSCIQLNNNNNNNNNSHDLNPPAQLRLASAADPSNTAGYLVNQYPRLGTLEFMMRQAN